MPLLGSNSLEGVGGGCKANEGLQSNTVAIHWFSSPWLVIEQPQRDTVACLLNCTDSVPVFISLVIEQPQMPGSWTAQTKANLNAQQKYLLCPLFNQLSRAINKCRIVFKHYQRHNKIEKLPHLRHFTTLTHHDPSRLKVKVNSCWGKEQLMGRFTAVSITCLQTLQTWDEAALPSL